MEVLGLCHRVNDERSDIFVLLRHVWPFCRQSWRGTEDRQRGPVTTSSSFRNSGLRVAAYRLAELLCRIQRVSRFSER